MFNYFVGFYFFLGFSYYRVLKSIWHHWHWLKRDCQWICHFYVWDPLKSIIYVIIKKTKYQVLIMNFGIELSYYITYDFEPVYCTRDSNLWKREGGLRQLKKRLKYLLVCTFLVSLSRPVFSFIFFVVLAEKCAKKY